MSVFSHILLKRLLLRLFLLLCLPVFVTGCARYQSKLLPDDAGMVETVDALVINASTQGGLQQFTHDINLNDGLDLTEIAILAVLNNPNLKSQRARLDIASAQLFSAGLLPDPQVSASFDKPTDSLPGLVNAWSAGLAYELIPLITRQARLKAERRGRTKLFLEVLWQEWQVMQQARSLAIHAQLEVQQLDLLRQILELYRQRYQHSARALQSGDITLDINGTDLTALVSTTSQIGQLEQTHNQTRHTLNLLLGLKPDAVLLFQPLSSPTWPDSQTIKAQLASLPQQRPDLLALKAGYESQEARVRTAILAQFPAISLGINRTRDTGKVHTNGIGISLNLPIFSRNRGPIAVERATRKQLQTEYRARLAQTASNADALIELQTIVTHQQSTLATYVPRLKKLVDRARVAYQKGDIDALTFLNMEQTWVGKRLEQIQLKQTQWDNTIAIETILALPGERPAPPKDLSERAR